LLPQLAATGVGIAALLIAAKIRRSLAIVVCHELPTAANHASLGHGMVSPIPREVQLALQPIQH